jgi:hypothetical protein
MQREREGEEEGEGRRRERDGGDIRGLKRSDLPKDKYQKV